MECPASESPVVEIPQYSNAPHAVPVQRLTSSADYYTANLAVAVPAHQSAFENYLKRDTDGPKPARLEDATMG